MYKKLAALFLISAIATPALASDIPLERVFSSPALSGPTPREARLSPDGRFVTLLKNRPDDRDRYDLWAIDTATGAERSSRARSTVRWAKPKYGTSLPASIG